MRPGTPAKNLRRQGALERLEQNLDAALKSSPAPEQRRAWEASVARMRAEIDRLKARLGPGRA